MGPVEIVMRATAATLVTASLAAQAPADFSGRWVRAPAPPPAATQRGGRTAPGTMGSGWGGDITITQDATTLTVQYLQFTRGDMQPPTGFVYLLNGSESTNVVNMGRGPQEQISTAAWDGSRLVITTRHRFKVAPEGEIMTSETRRVLSLESPQSLVIETTHGAVMGGQSSTTKTVYRKQ
jgi:hypothetical protein